MRMMKQELQRLLDLHQYELLERARAVVVSAKRRETYGFIGDFNRDIDSLKDTVNKIYGKIGG